MALLYSDMGIYVDLILEYVFYFVKREIFGDYPHLLSPPIQGKTQNLSREFRECARI